MRVVHFLVGFFLATLGVLFLMAVAEYGSDNLIAIPMFMGLGFIFAGPVGLVGCLLGEVMQHFLRLGRFTSHIVVIWAAYAVLGVAFGFAVGALLESVKYITGFGVAGALLFCLGRNHLAPRLFRPRTKS